MRYVYDEKMVPNVLLKKVNASEEELKAYTKSLR